MKIMLLGKTPMPSTEGNICEITYIRDEEGDHILLPTASSCRRTLIRLSRIVDANTARIESV